MQRIAPEDSAGFKKVGGVHRAAGRGAGADHRVDFVDEQDRAGIFLELLDDLLQPFLEVAAIAGAGEQRAHVEREDRRVGKHLRHVALDDALGQALGDGRLADAGIADIERIVLRTAAKDLNRAVDLVDRGRSADRSCPAFAFSLRLMQ